LFFVLPLLIASVAVVLVQAGVSATKAVYATAPKDDLEKFYRWVLTAFLHIIQPLARLDGRLTYDFTSRRKQGIDNLPFEFIVPKTRYFSIWSENWKSNEDWLRSIETNLIESKTKVRRGGEFDRYDLEANVGMFAFCRGLLVVEEHGAGKQLIRLRCRTRYSMFGIIPFTVFATLALFAAFGNSFIAAVILSAFSLLIGAAMLRDAARATKNLSLAFLGLNSGEIQKTDKIIIDSASDLESEEPFVVVPGAVAAEKALGNSE